MIFEIHGAGYHNYGAQLMLHAVASHLRETPSEARSCIHPRTRFDTFRNRAADQVEAMLPSRRVRAIPWYGLCERIAANILGPRFSERYGLVLPGETDGLIDISGYAYGDVWGYWAAHAFATKSRYCKRHFKPAVMLPQMMGPFCDPRLAGKMCLILNSTDLIYARDKESFNALQSLPARHDHIRMAPDITIFVDGVPVELLTDEPYACLVPNERMLDKGKRDWSDTYIELMCWAGKQILERGLMVMVIVHSPSSGDRQLAETIVRELASPRVRFVAERDPLTLKTHISRARFLVGSRFHAIVGGLSTHVPAITMGWAYKYPQLLADFEMGEFLHTSDHDKRHLGQLIEQCCDDARAADLADKLASAKQRMQQAHADMWESVDEVLAVSRKIQ